MDVAIYLTEVGEDLKRHGTTARQLGALEFDADGRDIVVLCRPGLHAEDYPRLDAILAEIGRGCLQDGVATSQLHRIVFWETKIDVELYDESGRSKVDNYPITAPQFRGRIDAAHPADVSSESDGDIMNSKR
jgi:hypothetical protein